MTQQHIYHLNPQGRPEQMQEKPFDAEADLQKLVADYPYLLSGEQMNPDNPRRFILIRQEQGIADTVGGSHRWYVDHLFIDQDAIPTLVEVKRRDNSEIRRSIVGQMLDYAAHAKLTLSVGDIRQAFEERVSAAGQTPDEVLAELLKEEPDADSFWQRVDDNLRAGRMCLLFVADGIPDELTRVVEFLNEQMTNINVLAVEIKQFLGETGSTLVPRVIGRTPESVAARERRSGSQPSHTEATFIDSFDDPAVQDAARRLFKVAQEHGAACRGRVSSITIRQSCPAWNRPIAVAWLYEPEAVGWGGRKGFFFGAGNNTDGFFESLPENLRDLLDNWINEFSQDGFATRADATGIRSYAISHADAADPANIDLLAARLERVLGELRDLPPDS